MDQRVLEQALKARDPRFDGRFFFGVKTTGIYCRPVCPARSPSRVNVLFFPTAAAASAAGFRPCLRCRPESSPGTPAWAGTSATVQRGLRLIGEGVLDDAGVDALSERLGITPRHLSRLFRQHLGASPKAIAQTRRLHFAKKLLTETTLPITAIALSTGYGSIRRFNDHLLQVYGRPPGELRRRDATPTVTGQASPLVLQLPYRPPYHFAGVLDFLRARAIPDVEQVGHGHYRRSIMVDGHRGSIEVGQIPDQHALSCAIDLPVSRSLMRVVERVRRIFDLNADPMEIRRCLGQDARLLRAIDQNPGLRVPGAWDPFEIAVRAIVGQQVSVQGATTTMGKIVQTFGEFTDGRRFFPTPESLSELQPEKLPLPGARATAIRDLSRAVRDGQVELDATDSAVLMRQLQCIKGIGPWTAQYVAMRATNDPDAFPGSDLVLLRVAREQLGLDSAQALASRAEAWRPWRAYASMYLWSMAH